MAKKLKIFIIAGEVSGDILGAKIMRALAQLQAKIEFSGVGGENMAAAGLRSIFPISDLAVMGFFEVLARVRILTRRIRETSDAILKFQPDIVLTIDSPSFAKAVIKKIKLKERRAQSADKKIPSLFALRSSLFYHVVAPQVWAWGERRAKKYAELFDRLYCFFDFEVLWFTKYGLETIPVGHPIADGLSAKRKEKREKRKEIDVALIPGSRMGEVKKLLPVLRCAAEMMRCKNPKVLYNFYIPVVETTEKYVREQTADWCSRPEIVPAPARYDLFRKIDLAIAASGTVTAELAILHVPAVVIYRMNPFTTMLARIFVKTKWASLVNILLRRTVYPELLGDPPLLCIGATGRYVTTENIVREVSRISTPAARAKMIAELSRADDMWTRQGKSAAKLIAESILKYN
ncbi:lipid-A-disaccharide synthase [Bacteroidia bacterium]|nr:lipid-A-disaccharide synthase [Bacteroidia bacterium]